MINWNWNTTTKTYDAADFGFGKGCHVGNTAIYTEKTKKGKGGTLFIGGWSNDAVVTTNTHVIDLTGTEHRLYEFPTVMDAKSVAFLEYTQPCKGWLSLPFPDYGTPDNIKTRAQWDGIAKEIRKILKTGVDVLVACTGGHGRSGMFCSIVGYILHNGTDGWESPVEKVRQIHCANSVETLAQENFVYKILDLSIAPTKVYAFTTSTFKKCPICGISSMFVKDFGMCKTCHDKYEKVAPLKHDLTVDDIDHPLEHKCDEGENCIGIYKADVCGHTVHNMIVSDGKCEQCSWAESHKAVEQEPEEKPNDLYGKCAKCGKSTYYGRIYGICWECSDDIQKSGAADYIHDSATDGCKYVPHTCDDVTCTGIFVPDVCKHTVHNRTIIGGLCPDCYTRQGSENKNEL